MTQYEWNHVYVPPDLSFTDNHAEVLPEEAQQLRDDYEAEHAEKVAAAEAYEEELANQPEPAPPAAPTLGALAPDAALIGSADVVLSCIGDGFVAGATIVFNGGDETTVFVDPTEVTTIVRPQTATTAGSYPVFVRNPDGQETDALGFTFTEEAA